MCRVRASSAQPLIPHCKYTLPYSPRQVALSGQRVINNQDGPGEGHMYTHCLPNDNKYSETLAGLALDRKVNPILGVREKQLTRGPSGEVHGTATGVIWDGVNEMNSEKLVQSDVLIESRFTSEK